MMKHDIVIGAPRGIQDSPAPAILQRNDEDFIDALMDECRTDPGRRALQDSLAQARNGAKVLKLYQPIQRQFHVALIEVWCDTPGTPRLDPARIDSAGMVIRRISDKGHEGWMQAKGRLRGWVALDRLGKDRSDPTSAVRLASAVTGVRDIDHSLMNLALEKEDALLNEHVIPLFAAPPDVCTAAKKTLYYGLVQTTSAELAESPVSFEDETFTAVSQEFRYHLVQGLRGERMDFARAGETLQPEWLDAVDTLSKDLTTIRLSRFILMLRQLTGEFGLFDADLDSSAVIKELHAINLPLVLRQGETIRRTVTADVFLQNAVAVLLQHNATAPTTEMPEYWPELDKLAAQRLMGALYQVMAARFATMKGRPGRFDQSGATYVVRAFIRLKPECGCPAKTLWSKYSEPFVIAPWYEGSGAPPAQIALPDITDPALLKSLKPNVAFLVPPKLQSLFNVSPKNMLAGKGEFDPSLTLGWICGFNIPTITICAFIVLNIFLSLFDLIFGWMFSVKICLPYPKKKPQP